MFQGVEAPVVALPVPACLGAVPVFLRGHGEALAEGVYEVAVIRKAAGVADIQQLSLILVDHLAGGVEADGGDIFLEGLV